MDFTNRSNQPQQTPSNNPFAAPAAAVTNKAKSIKKNDGKFDWMKAGAVVFLVAIVVVIVGVLALLLNGNSNSNNQSGFVNSSKYQAVFLNSGQVYFGHIKAINSTYFDLHDIYYLQTSSTGTTTTTTANNSNVSLVKLGCELHQPYDQMIIQRSEVTFWENLKDGGQVAKAIKQYQTQNPNGQTCSTTTGSTTQSSNVQGTTDTTTNTNASTNTSTNSTNKTNQ